MKNTKNSDNEVQVTGVTYKPNNKQNEKISCTIEYKGKTYNIKDGKIVPSSSTTPTSTSTTQTPSTTPTPASTSSTQTSSTSTAKITPDSKDDPNITVLQNMFNSSSYIPLTFTVERVK